MSCPDSNSLAAYAVGELLETKLAEIEIHLSDCPSCRAAVLASGRSLGDGAAADVSDPARRGASLGRFLILDVIGQGGMGVVYAAFDPELDRKVAIKVLKSAAGRDDAAKARLTREARTMARLAHPNVVVLYDVGTVGDEIFLAMELVEGGTLGQWVRAEPRPWREVVRMFAAAGRGLAAAHEAELVHRDFKPDNVLIGRDGRPRVGDFGLARDSEVALAPDTPVENVQTAGLIGTPAYMAPEQLRLKPASPLSDQFSFCTALFEALYGRRPYAGDRISELLASMETGRVVDARADGVPASVQRALLRGLRPRPEERYASMAELVEALEVSPRRQWLLATSIAPLAMAIATAALVFSSGGRSAPSCDGNARLADVWNPEKRAAVTAMLTANSRPYARDAAASVERSFDAHSAAWAAMYREACEASVRGEQSAELLDRRMECLDKSRGQLAGMIELLASAPADDALLKRVGQAAAAIPSVAPCADRAALLAVVAPPASPEAREHAARLRRRLGDARALFEAWRLTEGRAVAAALADEAKLAESPQLEAEIRNVLAKIDTESKNHDAADAEYRRAATMAARAHDDPLLASIFIGLANNHKAADQLREAREVAAVAQVLLTRAGDNALERARLLRLLANVDFGTNPEASLTVAREALELVRGAGAPSLDMISTLGVLSTAEYHTGRLNDARAHVTETLALAEQFLGRTHPRLAFWLNNLGVLAGMQGDEKARVDYYRQALARAEEGLGLDDVEVGAYAMNLGNAYADLGMTREARPLVERGLALKRQHLGPDHSEVAQAMNNLSYLELSEGHAERSRELADAAVVILERAGSRMEMLGMALETRGNAHLALGARDKAIADHERSLALLEKTSGPKHPLTATALIALGNDWVRSGQPAKATELFGRALAIGESDDSAKSVRDDALIGLGEAALAARQHDKALSYAERALAMREEGINTVAIAHAKWLTARALRAAKRDPERARALAEAAAAGFVDGTPELAEVRAWLRR